MWTQNQMKELVRINSESIQNSEADASVLLGNLEEMFLLSYTSESWTNVYKILRSTFTHD